MSDVVLVFPPYTWEMKQPPIGLAYIAAVLERAGYSVAICDMNPLKLKAEDIADVLKRHAPRVIGLSSMTPQIPIVHRIALAVKALDPSVSIVVGGPHVSAIPEETLNDCPSIDFVAVGEGEITMTELVGALLDGASTFGHINGLAYRENGVVKVNPPRTDSVDVNSLPYPAWHLLPMDRYSAPGYGGKIDERTHVMLASRGCPYHCVFCDSHSVFGRVFRYRDPKSIVEEMEYLHQTYAITQFDFADDMLTVNRKWLTDLCEMMMERRIPEKMRWMANARVNTVDRYLLKLLRDAGCVRVDYGVESGDPKVLKAVKKNITIDQAVQAHQWTREVGLKVGTFLMVGNLEEDRESAEKTVELAREIRSNFPSVSIATPFPGSELYEIAKAKGWLMSTDWSRYGTSPRLQPRDYRPLMRTEFMSPEDILEAYYYVISRLFRINLQSRYGERFLLNPNFYRDKRIFSYKGVDDAFHRLDLAVRMLRSLV
ncbi:MAG: B12-binding domain-containing radical SAM protein [Chloroflexi bacterium]|nr:B12-binding domain-containing radical SAM protein [Chloroflexota bacterium]